MCAVINPSAFAGHKGLTIPSSILPDWWHHVGHTHTHTHTPRGEQRALLYHVHDCLSCCPVSICFSGLPCEKPVLFFPPRNELITCSAKAAFITGPSRFNQDLVPITLMEDNSPPQSVAQVEAISCQCESRWQSWDMNEEDGKWMEVAKYAATVLWLLI